MSEGEKIAVIGAVGSGKTSLLLSILGEMPIHEGKLLTRKSKDVIIVEQEALIITGTVEQNILFGLEKDPEWYKEVIRACCLDEDFSVMPSGD